MSKPLPRDKPSTVTTEHRQCHQIGVTHLATAQMQYPTSAKAHVTCLQTGALWELMGDRQLVRTDTRTDIT